MALSPVVVVVMTMTDQYDAAAAAAAQEQRAGATWETLVAAAADDPVLYRVVRHAEHYGREAALIQAVVFLAGERKKIIEIELDRLRRSPAAPIYLPQGGGK